MAKQFLVIVESPTKAKTIRKFLPKNFHVEASMGHIRDLPQSATDIPAKLKKEEWTKIGVNVEDSFAPLYIIPKGKSKIISELKKKLVDADELYLATDEDREGESISWHLVEVLKPKIPIKRMVFHEITKSAIENSITDCRDIDQRLVKAQEARRILDRLVGYTLSPLIWKKIAYGLSAGRVQSSALRMVVERERERFSFQKASYWDIQAELEKGKDAFESKIHSLNGKRIASGKDFDEKTGKLSDGKDVLVLDEKTASELSKTLKNKSWKVIAVDEKDFTSKPSAPFITSTLQQEANRKLGMSSREAMRTAQKLYEEGLITYMRTDSPNLSSQAISAARQCVEDLYGKEYLSPTPRQYTSKAKGAQEAHEAIRPAGSQFVHPKEAGLSGKEYALYELIWMRTMATQMAEAQKKSVSIKIESGNAIFSASGTRILFPGFIRAYVEGRDDPDAALEDREVLLPNLKIGDQLNVKSLQPNPHETKPPARFTEASLVQGMEKAGIARPSTYASIISTIIDRNYVKKVGNALIPTFTGFAVIQLLEKYFNQLVDLNFTSKMEESLDEIAEGKLDWLKYLKEFYLGKEGLKEQVELKEKKIKPEESRTVDLSHIKSVEVKIGRYGAYLVKEATKDEDEIHATIPEDVAPSDLTEEKTVELIETSKKGPTSMGVDPKTGKNIYCLVGRYGPYVQLGEVTEEDKKPRRASVPKEIDLKTLTLEQALKFLSLPRELGNHPASGKPILTNLGRFGPYVMHDGDFRSLKKEDNVYTVTLERALELLSQEKKGRGGSKMIKELGNHPEKNKLIGIYEGKYGPYIKMGTKNFSLPKEKKPEDFTLQEALEIINASTGKSKKKK